MQELLLAAVPIGSFILGLIVGAGGTLLYMRRKIRKMMQNPFEQLGENLDG